MAIMIVMRLIVASIATLHAREFLRATPKVLSERLSEAELRSTLLEEIETSLGAGSAGNRLLLLEANLLPVFNALPKNEHGRLGHATVRYALHRLFVMRHGWSIKGLRADATSWNSSSATGILLGQASSYVQDLFEQRLGGRGLALHELTVLASTIEHLIHNEAAGKMTSVFNVLEISPTSILSDSDANHVLDTYMMAFILGQDLSTLNLKVVKSLNAAMPTLFSGWQEAQEFVRRVKGNITNPGEEGDFASMVKTVEVVGEEYGSFQNIECRQLKSTLMKMEDRGTGRVKLSEFYKPALNGNWQFQESVSYLRKVGALDESDSTSKSVIIPNYLYSQANCIASSAFYAVCCKDECEGLLGHIEEKLVVPEATPQEIIRLVSNLPSSTITAPRKMSATLLRRLDDIASQHGGMIPLHGRLFAQWLHHAFPRECPYPHLSGTTSQQTTDEYLAESGDVGEATEEEMRQYMIENSTTDNTADSESVAVEELLEWSTVEELLVVRHEPQLAGATSTRATLRSFIMVVAACSLAYGLVKSFKLPGSASDLDHAKYVV